MSKLDWDLINNHMDADTCYICGKAVSPGVSGEPIHGMTGAHWNCTEDSKRPVPKALEVLKSLVAAELRPPSQFLGMAKGGHLVHVVDNVTQTALCGHHPQSGGTHKMVDRSGWQKVRDSWADQPNALICKTCSRKSEGAI